jgi:hypothetical protein
VNCGCQEGSRRGASTPSAAVPAGRIRRRCLGLFLLWLLGSWAAVAESSFCGPGREVRLELEKAAALPVSEASAFARNISAFESLRARFPNDLFVHESYQDAVKRFGVEGHLRGLTDEYQTLAAEHPGDLIFRYLYARSLLGRGTYPAIQEMTEILAVHPEFAPAHRMLAEVYAIETFRDAQKERAYRESLLKLCPGSVLSETLTTLLDRSPLLEQAVRLSRENGDPDRVADLARQGLHEDEWRLQRIRPFDWYSLEFKIQNQRQLQAEYWSVWSLEVRCDLKAGRRDQARSLQATMEQRAAQIRMGAGDTYWDALVILGRLYAETGQAEQAAEKVEAMQKVVAARPDPARVAEIEELGKLIRIQGAQGSGADARIPAPPR